MGGKGVSLLVCRVCECMLAVSLSVGDGNLEYASVSRRSYSARDTRYKIQRYKKFYCPHRYKEIWLVCGKKHNTYIYRNVQESSTLAQTYAHILTSVIHTGYKCLPAIRNPHP